MQQSVVPTVNNSFKRYTYSLCVFKTLSQVFCCLNKTHKIEPIGLSDYATVCSTPTKVHLLCVFWRHMYSRLRKSCPAGWKSQEHKRRHILGTISIWFHQIMKYCKEHVPTFGFSAMFRLLFRLREQIRSIMTFCLFVLNHLLNPNSWVFWGGGLEKVSNGVSESEGVEEEGVSLRPCPAKRQNKAQVRTVRVCTEARTRTHTHATTIWSIETAHSESVFENLNFLRKHSAF